MKQTCSNYTNNIHENQKKKPTKKIYKKINNN